MTIPGPAPPHGDGTPRDPPPVDRHDGSAARWPAPEGEDESVHEPAKVMRIAIMARQLLDELRDLPLDQRSRDRLRDIYDQSLRELAGTLSPDLAHELEEMARPLEEPDPTDAELRVAQAQLVGWLEGLFRGIQAAVFAQQVAAQADLQRMRPRQMLAPGRQPDSSEAPTTGTYL
ncbi:MAG: proteasome activator [Acidimicrobiales bacterium]